MIKFNALMHDIYVWKCYHKPEWVFSFGKTRRSVQGNVPEEIYNGGISVGSKIEFPISPARRNAVFLRSATKLARRSSVCILVGYSRIFTLLFFRSRSVAGGTTTGISGRSRWRIRPGITWCVTVRWSYKASRRATPGRTCALPVIRRAASPWKWG